MSSKSARDTEYMLNTLQRAGITRADAESLRRISMTLHRWHELECGVDNGCIEREESDPDGGRPFWRYSDGRRSAFMADREHGAKTRLASIMARYPTLSAYIQGDPRGCALYIIRPGDVPEGADVGSYYSRGLAVYK